MPDSIPDLRRPLISVIVLNWNGEKYIQRCLDSIAAQTFTDYEVIVVDNASTDHSADDIENRWPGFRLLLLDENLGFAKANNLGAQIARGQWLAFLNNDAFPSPAWLEKLVNAIHGHPQFSFFASCIVQENHPDLIESTGDVYNICGLAWPRDHNAPCAQARPEADEVFSACAAAAMYNREAFLQVGGFDEDFSSHHEDVDLGFRLRLAGYRCLYVPEATVWHIGSASYGAQSDRTVYQVQRNLVWSYVTNMPGHLFWKYLPAHIFSNMVFLLYYPLKGQIGPAWRAKLDALHGLPDALRRRRNTQRNRSVEPEELSRVMDHSWLRPYLLGKNAHKIQRLGRLFGSGQDRSSKPFDQNKNTTKQ